MYYTIQLLLFKQIREIKIRKKVTVIIIIILNTQITPKQCMPKLTNSYSKNCLDNYSQSRYNPVETDYLQIPEFNNRNPRIGNKNVKFRKDTSSQQLLYKTFNFPDVEYPLFNSPRNAFHLKPDQVSYIFGQGKEFSSNIHASKALNDLKKQKRMNRKLKRLKNTNYNPNIEMPFLTKYLSSYQPIWLKDSETFPEVQYPMNAIETWIPNYWNPFFFTEIKSDIPVVPPSEPGRKNKRNFQSCKQPLKYKTTQFIGGKSNIGIDLGELNSKIGDNSSEDTLKYDLNIRNISYTSAAASLSIAPFFDANEQNNSRKIVLSSDYTSIDKLTVLDLPTATSTSESKELIFTQIEPDILSVTPIPTPYIDSVQHNTCPVYELNNIKKEDINSTIKQDVGTRNTINDMKDEVKCNSVCEGESTNAKLSLKSLQQITEDQIENLVMPDIFLNGNITHESIEFYDKKKSANTSANTTKPKDQDTDTGPWNVKIPIPSTDMDDYKITKDAISRKYECGRYNPVIIIPLSNFIRNTKLADNKGSADISLDSILPFSENITMLKKSTAVDIGLDSEVFPYNWDILPEKQSAPKKIIKNTEVTPKGNKTDNNHQAYKMMRDRELLKIPINNQPSSESVLTKENLTSIADTKMCQIQFNNVVNDLLNEDLQDNINVEIKNTSSLLVLECPYTHTDWVIRSDPVQQIVADGENWHLDYLPVGKIKDALKICLTNNSINAINISHSAFQLDNTQLVNDKKENVVIGIIQSNPKLDSHECANRSVNIAENSLLPVPFTVTEDVQNVPVRHDNQSFKIMPDYKVLHVDYYGPTALESVQTDGELVLSAKEAQIEEQNREISKKILKNLDGDIMTNLNNNISLSTLQSLLPDLLEPNIPKNDLQQKTVALDNNLHISNLTVNVIRYALKLFLNKLSDKSISSFGKGNSFLVNDILQENSTENNLLINITKDALELLTYKFLDKSFRVDNSNHVPLLNDTEYLLNADTTRNDWQISNTKVGYQVSNVPNSIDSAPNNTLNKEKLFPLAKKTLAEMQITGVPKKISTNLLDDSITDLNKRIPLSMLEPSKLDIILTEVTKGDLARDTNLFCENMHTGKLTAGAIKYALQLFLGELQNNSINAIDKTDSVSPINDIPITIADEDTLLIHMIKDALQLLLYKYFIKLPHADETSKNAKSLFENENVVEKNEMNDNYGSTEIMTPYRILHAEGRGQSSFESVPMEEKLVHSTNETLFQMQTMSVHKDLPTNLRDAYITYPQQSVHISKPEIAQPHFFSDKFTGNGIMQQNSTNTHPDNLSADVIKHVLQMFFNKMPYNYKNYGDKKSILLTNDILLRNASEDYLFINVIKDCLQSLIYNLPITSAVAIEKNISELPLSVNRMQADAMTALPYHISNNCNDSQSAAESTETKENLFIFANQRLPQVQSSHESKELLTNLWNDSTNNVDKSVIMSMMKPLSHDVTASVFLQKVAKLHENIDTNNFSVDIIRDALQLFLNMLPDNSTNFYQKEIPTINYTQLESSAEDNLLINIIKDALQLLVYKYPVKSVGVDKMSNTVQTINEADSIVERNPMINNHQFSEIISDFHVTKVFNNGEALLTNNPIKENMLILPNETLLQTQTVNISVNSLMNTQGDSITDFNISIPLESLPYPYLIIRSDQQGKKSTLHANLYPHNLAIDVKKAPQLFMNKSWVKPMHSSKESNSPRAFYESEKIVENNKNSNNQSFEITTGYRLSNYSNKYQNDLITNQHQSTHTTPLESLKPDDSFSDEVTSCLLQQNSTLDKNMHPKNLSADVIKYALHSFLNKFPENSTHNNDNVDLLLSRKDILPGNKEQDELLINIIKDALQLQRHKLPKISPDAVKTNNLTLVLNDYGVNIDAKNNTEQEMTVMIDFHTLNNTNSEQSTTESIQTKENLVILSKETLPQTKTTNVSIKVPLKFQHHSMTDINKSVPLSTRKALPSDIRTIAFLEENVTFDNNMRLHNMTLDVIKHALELFLNKLPYEEDWVLPMHNLQVENMIKDNLLINIIEDALQLLLDKQSVKSMYADKRTNTPVLFNEAEYGVEKHTTKDNYIFADILPNDHDLNSSDHSQFTPKTVRTNETLLLLEFLQPDTLSDKTTRSDLLQANATISKNIYEENLYVDVIKRALHMFHKKLSGNSSNYNDKGDDILLLNHYIPLEKAVEPNFLINNRKDTLQELSNKLLDKSIFNVKRENSTLSLNKSERGMKAHTRNGPSQVTKVMPDYHILSSINDGQFACENKSTEEKLILSDDQRRLPMQTSNVLKNLTQNVQDDAMSSLNKSISLSEGSPADLITYGNYVSSGDTRCELFQENAPLGTNTLSHNLTAGVMKQALHLLLNNLSDDSVNNIKEGGSLFSQNGIRVENVGEHNLLVNIIRDALRLFFAEKYVRDIDDINTELIYNEIENMAKEHTSNDQALKIMSDNHVLKTFISHPSTSQRILNDNENLLPSTDKVLELANTINAPKNLPIIYEDISVPPLEPLYSDLPIIVIKDALQLFQNQFPDDYINSLEMGEPVSLTNVTQVGKETEQNLLIRLIKDALQLLLYKHPKDLVHTIEKNNVVHGVKNVNNTYSHETG